LPAESATLTVPATSSIVIDTTMLFPAVTAPAPSVMVVVVPAVVLDAVPTFFTNEIAASLRPAPSATSATIIAATNACDRRRAVCAGMEQREVEEHRHVVVMETSCAESRGALGVRMNSGRSRMRSRVRPSARDVPPIGMRKRRKLLRS
jgi:hypothetical protein